MCRSADTASRRHLRTHVAAQCGRRMRGQATPQRLTPAPPTDVALGPIDLVVQSSSFSFDHGVDFATAEAFRPSRLAGRAFFAGGAGSKRGSQKSGDELGSKPQPKQQTSTRHGFRRRRSIQGSIFVQDTVCAVNSLMRSIAADGFLPDVLSATLLRTAAVRMTFPCAYKHADELWYSLRASCRIRSRLSSNLFMTRAPRINVRNQRPQGRTQPVSSRRLTELWEMQC